MQPLSPHWADIAAIKVIKGRGDKEQYVVASGITPSGKIHVGNFREVITVDLVARALKAQGKKVRFIYSWDNFDTFRKVPKNLPDPDNFEPCLRKPIARIPDPWGEADSYAQGRINLFEKELQLVGIAPEYRYQESLYSSGLYAESIRTALEQKNKIVSILNEHRSSDLSEDWLPTSIYCSKCSRDEMKSQTYEGEWIYRYECAGCGHTEDTDIRSSKNIKLSWRIDWPMRWAHEKVDFEPGGKDHSSQGGSYDTGKKIIKEVWNQSAPEYLQYDFVMIKGGSGKMSSSSGELYTLEQVLEVYEPQIVRWIFANHRPNHDFAIAFDEDVIKIYEEFDKSEQLAFSPKPEKKPGKWPVNRRTYELSTVDGIPSDDAPVRASFRLLCNRLQICGEDIERTFSRFYASDIVTSSDKERFFARAERARNWLEKYAPEEFRYTINQSRGDVDLNSKQAEAICALKNLIAETDLEKIAPKDLNDLIWEKAVHGTSCEPKALFSAVYQILISRDQGPRLPGFLKEIGKEKLLELL